MLDVITLFLFSIIVYNIPLLYGTTGEIMIEKSGSLNLGVEGTMAIGAVAGYLLGMRSGSLLVAVLISFIASGLVGLVFAFLTVTLQANQNVTGLTITTFGVAFYYFVGNAVSNSASKWPALGGSSLDKQFAPVEIPLLSKIPVIGKVLFSHSILIYLGVVIAIVMWLYFEKTNPGLKLRAIGENPGAADSLGVNIKLEPCKSSLGNFHLRILQYSQSSECTSCNGLPERSRMAYQDTCTVLLRAAVHYYAHRSHPEFCQEEQQQQRTGCYRKELLQRRQIE